MVYVFLADGFEETEAIVPIDLLIRAGIKVTTVGVGSATPTGAHGLTVMTDVSDELFLPGDNVEAIVLPGGMPGTANLALSETVKRAVRLASQEEITVAAICAAPSVLAAEGVLGARKATVYPSFKDRLGGNYKDADVVYDAPFLTARAAGSAFDFALRLIEIIKDKNAAKEVAGAIYYK